MIGIDLIIEKPDGEKFPYAILYSEVFEMHVAHMFDDTMVETRITELDWDKFIAKVYAHINLLGTITYMKERKHDEKFAELIQKMKK